MKKIIFLISFIIIFLLGILSGKKIGTNNLPQYSMYDTSTYDGRVAANLRNEIRILKYLKTDKSEDAKEMLEKMVDNDISHLNAEYKITKYTPETEKRIIESIKEAKEYRQKYSNHVPIFSKDINEAFRRFSGL